MKKKYMTQDNKNYIFIKMLNLIKLLRYVIYINTEVFNCVRSICQLPDERIVSTGDSKLKIWNIRTQMLEHVFEYKEIILCTIGLPDGRFACGSTDNKIRIWS